MLLLGFDEMIAVLYNPLWLILAVVLILFGKTVYEVRLHKKYEVASVVKFSVDASAGSVLSRLQQHC
jgi:hypothetical protein